MSTALLPKTSFLPDVQPVAELSSAAAARRSVSISTIGTKRAANGQGKNKGKPSEDIQGSTSATEGDDLESISGSSEVLIDIKDERETSKRKYKKIKGLDGKAVRSKHAASRLRPLMEQLLHDHGSGSTRYWASRMRTTKRQRRLLRVSLSVYGFLPSTDPIQVQKL
jgi:hypothetical protein